jgi:flagellar basal body-associated protein FliL
MRITAMKVFAFYKDGFARMTVGKSLWKIIIIKLVVMFAVLKLFFFPNFLKQNFETDEQRANHVLEQITRQVAENN